MLEALYQRYYKELYIFVFSLCASESVTDDILQDTFLKALLTLKDSHTNMRAWLYMVARNLYYNYYNRQKKQMTIESSDFEHAAMEVQLKGQKKEVILLQYFGDFSQKEIAAMLKITPGNVKVLSYRAKKELKEYLTKEEGR